MPVVGLSGISSLAVGFDVTCAVLSGGLATCWGANASGQLGTGSLFDFSVEPVPVSGLTQVTQLAVSSLHVCALLADGSVWCWGDSAGSGRLGSGTATSSAVPRRVAHW